MAAAGDVPCTDLYQMLAVPRGASRENARLSVLAGPAPRYLAGEGG